MKIYKCDRCEPFDGESCILQCDDMQNPTHCTHTDSTKPYATWIEQDTNKQNKPGNPLNDKCDLSLNCPYLIAPCEVCKH